MKTYPARDVDTFDPLADTVRRSIRRPAVVPAGAKDLDRAGARNARSRYETTVIDPETHQAVPFTVPRETLRYRFFATAGSFAPATSERADSGFVPKGPIHIESEYRLPGAAQVTLDADGLATVTMWIVVRDDRGGESWAVRTLRVTPL